MDPQAAQNVIGNRVGAPKSAPPQQAPAKPVIAAGQAGAAGRCENRSRELIREPWQSMRGE